MWLTRSLGVNLHPTSLPGGRLGPQAYVGASGCDHVSHPELFLPDDFVAGAPPDDLNALGQKWGNPLYDWEALEQQGYRWWVERMRRTLGLIDVFRIDHFRGFAAYWAVPAAAETAREGAWAAAEASGGA